MSVFGLLKRDEEVGLGRRIEREVSLSNDSSDVVAVFGTRTDGAYEMADGFEEYLRNQGVEDINVRVLRDAGQITKVFNEYGENLKGVVLLSQMRQYHPESGAGMTLDSFNSGISNYVEKLCTERNIPLVELRGNPKDRQITDEIKKFSSGTK